jgi:hypothetical protein
MFEIDVCNYGIDSLEEVMFFRVTVGNLIPRVCHEIPFD